MKSTNDFLLESSKNSNIFYELTPKEQILLRNELLSIYKDIKAICQKYNLTHMLGGGSVLGAVRHKGFIPWDDDIDLYVPRKDYDKLLALRHDLDESKFKLMCVHDYPYFLSTFPFLQSKLLYIFHF